MEGQTERVRVEAIGEPGQRRFRLMAIIDGETHVAWMEKQQLQALGLALEQLLDQLPDTGPDLSPESIATFDPESRKQFRVGKIELGYEERTDRIVVIAHDVASEDEEPAMTCRLTREMTREISADAAAVVAAGRPRCTMCGSPMGPGPHVCPEQNGHFPQAIVEISPEDMD